MRNYELTVVLDGKATPAKKKSVTELVKSASRRLAFIYFFP
ncbi:MAG: hypothetical protein UW61_C0028G0015 [Candidatus Curtissbacteria bacterium GW2011_GWC1_44_33]|uniref:30S ribosomal protein S6 n=1 Tax=Candidatus Curtissbacteria bacterium GW2011_GWC1_44_33 TaxID=1618413 RepID=A0A0G1J4T3_9BACT|nr:MAG: hypothetical protein UW61_C0028G0015 [Candidatus Curtissbacteria bacterium GW2011_GWC1_44_33]